jgi:multiple sugar transport system permease protein
MTSLQDTAAPPARSARTDASLLPARRRSLRYLALYLLALGFVSPLVYMLATSFKTRADAASTVPSWIPDPVTTQAYQYLFSAPDTPVLTWFANSMLAATATAALVVATASLAAYPLARMEFRGKRVVFALVIAMLMVPGVILVIPNYLIVSELGWLNTLTAIIVPSAASAFGVFFMRQFFTNLPVELEEAALLDGANRFQVFVRVVVPLARPAMATLALLAFLTNWNDFLWPVYVLFSPETRTLPAGLATLQGANQVRYDVLMAGAVIASVPVMLLFSFLQRFIIEGVSRSGLKG